MEWRRRAGGYKVHSLVIEDNHTYFVGNAAGGLWVHNQCGGVGVAESIAKGHAFDKHVLTKNEFEGLEIRTREQFADFIDGIMQNATGADVRSLSRGRTAYWDTSSGTLVIQDPNHIDLSTAFRPTFGRAYFDGLR